MNCPPFDVRGYFLGELSPAEAGEVERHLPACARCRGELEALRHTRAALLALADEEIPQRIGFVSDKVFEPSGWRRAWAAFWNSGPRLGFASAAMLSAALVAPVFQRPAPAPQPAPPAVVAASPVTPAEIAAAVERAVARSEAKTAALLKEMERRENLERAANLVSYQESLAVLQKRLNVMLLASNTGGGE
jgi:anti-sigma factor RsiW